MIGWGRVEGERKIFWYKNLFEWPHRRHEVVKQHVSWEYEFKLIKPAQNRGQWTALALAILGVQCLLVGLKKHKACRIKVDRRLCLFCNKERQPTYVSLINWTV
jgi:hypothetical protein